MIQKHELKQTFGIMKIDVINILETGEFIPGENI